jgi:hypothetical protein
MGTPQGSPLERFLFSFALGCVLYSIGSTGQAFFACRLHQPAGAASSAISPTAGVEFPSHPPGTTQLVSIGKRGISLKVNNL